MTRLSRIELVARTWLLVGLALSTWHTTTVVAAEPLAWSPSRMLGVLRVASVHVSPNGQQVAYTVRTPVMLADKSEYRTHIHLATADGKRSRALTQGDASCSDPQWSPDGQWIAFITNRVGKKNLWCIRSDGGEAQQLTEMKSDVNGFRWSNDGATLAFSATDAPSSDDERRNREKDDARVIDANINYNRLYLMAFKSPPAIASDPRCLTLAERSVTIDGSRAGRSAFDWSSDNRSIVYSHTRTPKSDDWSSSDISVVEVASGKVTALVATAAAEGSPLYSPDGQSIAYTASDAPPTWAGTRTVHVIAASGGTSRALSDTYDGFGRSSELVGFSRDGSRLLYSEAHGTTTKLRALPMSGAAVDMFTTEGVSSSGFALNATRSHVGYSWEGLQSPPEAWSSPVEAFAPQQASHVQASLPIDQLGTTKVIRWKSTDGLEIEGLLTYPLRYQAGTKVPLLLVVHGGPMGVFAQTFDGTASQYPVAAFAEQGYAVLRPNPRGSSGYGKKFRYANYGDWGGGDFRDLMTGVDHVIAQGIADPDRLGVMGWSYGGYMTSWTITQTRRFRAASVGAGVTNLMSFTGTADIPGFLPDYFGGEFWNSLAAYRDHSAMFHVQGVKTPTLIQHGERDERVPLSQGQELYNALKRQGCVTQMVVYPRTPHSIDEPRLLLDCMQRNLDWFEHYVLRPHSSR